MTNSATPQQTIDLPDEAATVRLAQTLARAYLQQEVSVRVQLVTLTGTLGAGKTTLVRAFLRALGWTGPVKSPTYTLVETYPLEQHTVVHFDWYRLADAEELENLGARDYFSRETLCWVEWPDRGAGFLPVADLALTLHTDAASGRRLSFCAQTAAAQHWVAALEQEFAQ